MFGSEFNLVKYHLKKILRRMITLPSAVGHSSGSIVHLLSRLAKTRAVISYSSSLAYTLSTMEGIADFIDLRLDERASMSAFKVRDPVV